MARAHGYGISSVEDLAGLDLADQAFLDSYLPEVGHVRDPLGRLQVAVRRASMIEAGVTIERETNGPDPRSPRGHRDRLRHRVGPRQPGLPLGRVGQSTRCPARVRADVQLAAPGRREVAAPRATVRDVAQRRRHCCWSAGSDRADLPLLASRTEAPRPSCWVRERRRSDRPLRGPARTCPAALLRTRGPRIKKVAPAFGSTGADEDPGGLQSRCGFSRPGTIDDSAIAESAQQRILQYNEDDVRATAILRAGLADT